MKRDPLKLMIAGEGGQGIQLLAEILAYTADYEGKYASYIPNFGVEQRGGVSIAYLQISENPIPFPKFKIADILVVLSDRAVARTEQYIGNDTIYIYDNSLIHQREITVEERDHKKKPQIKSHRFLISQLLKIPAGELAKERLNPKVFNMIILGGILATIRIIQEADVEKILEIQLGDKFKANPELAQLDFKAIRLGVELVKKHGIQLEKVHSAQDIEKEFIYRGPKAIIYHYPSVCKGCGLCIEKCPVRCISFIGKLGAYGTPIPAPDMKRCIGCGNCERICPDCAFKVIRKGSS